jgi:hypothetical protein
MYKSAGNSKYMSQINANPDIVDSLGPTCGPRPTGTVTINKQWSATAGPPELIKFRPQMLWQGQDQTPRGAFAIWIALSITVPNLLSITAGRFIELELSGVLNNIN